MNWKNKKVLVTGGASFIGSHLVDALVDKGARVTAVDDLSSGRIENIKEHIKQKRIKFYLGDLCDINTTRKAVRGQDFVFHLAAVHGGRGFVQLHQSDTAVNNAIDGLVFRTCLEEKVEKVIYASSGCVYPNYLQEDVNKRIYLTEDMAGPPYDPDNVYGAIKLLGEISLKAYFAEHGMKSVSLRYFTVYGPRGVENHAVMAMIAKVFIGENPIEIWGDGSQIRNWTYVDDIVRGTLLAAEKVSDGTCINLGTMERIRVMDAIRSVCKNAGHHARIVKNMKMPIGPVNRVASNKLAKRLLGWQPEVMFDAGLRRTMDWYFANKNKTEIKKTLHAFLTAR